MAKPNTIVARKLFDFREVVKDRHVIATTVGPNLNPIVLSLGKPPDYRIDKGGASFAKQRADEPNYYRIHYSLDDQWLTVDIESTHRNVHVVQPLGTEQWLLVCCRASSPTDRNALVTDCYGRIVHSFHAGDGIEGVQATADGRIWCSFFDQGIFNDMEMGQSGLVCLDSQGNKLFDYGQIVEQSDEVSDCYALNVRDKHETWLYYYTNFPLVAIYDYKLATRWRRMPVSGSHAFAIDDQHALFFGNYNERNVLFKVALSSMRVQKLLAVTEDARRIRACSAFGRGPRLYLVTDTSLFSVDCQQ